AMTIPTLSFIDNPAINGREDRYCLVSLNIDKALKGWKLSLIAHEWLTPDGNLKPLDALSLQNRQRVVAVQDKLQSGDAPIRPVFGIGLLDNLEIGSGREVFYALAAAGHKTITGHIPVSNQAEFAPY